MPHDALLKRASPRLRNRRAYAIPSAATYSMYLNSALMAAVDLRGVDMVKSRSEIVEVYVRYCEQQIALRGKEAMREIFG